MKISFDQLQPTVLEHLNGGQGALVSRRHQDDNVKISKGMLSPGSSIGLHTHGDTSEVLYVLSGSAVMYMDGVAEVLTAGECHYCPQGHSHTLVNESGEDVTFLAIVPKHR